MKPRLAYLVMREPEIFLIHEILGLARAGFDLVVFGVRGAKPTPAADKLQGITIWYYGYLSRAVLGDMAYWLRRQPGSLSYILWQITRRTWRKPHQWVLSMLLVPKSFSIARQIDRDGIQIVHAAWGHYPAVTLCAIKRLLPHVKTTLALGAYDLVARHPMTILAATQAEAILTQSDASASFIRSVWPRTKTPVIAIMRGVNFEIVGAVPPGETVPGQIVSVGRLLDVKGHQHVIHAVAAIRAEHPDARLIIYGEGKYRPVLERLVQDLGLTNVVSLPGRVDQSQLFGQLAQAAAFVLASEWEGENMPNVVKEAMAFGVPVITTFTTGIEDLIDNGTTGLLVNQGDIAAIEHHLRAILDDPLYGKQLAQAGKRAVRERFDLRETSKARAQLYRTFLSNDGSSNQRSC